MNIYQRIILILGAITLVFVLLTAPKVKHIQVSSIDMVYKEDAAGEMYEGVASVVDVRTASVRGAAVLGVTVLLYFAAKSRKGGGDE